MGRGRRRVRAVAAVTAGALPFALGVGTASADEFYSQFFARDHTFTAGDGSTVTCTFSGNSNLFRGSAESAFHADALTDASGSDESCGIHFVEVIATYRDAQGVRKTTGADSVDGDVRWFADDVGGEFSVLHRVTFGDCIANCETSFTTSPK